MPNIKSSIRSVKTDAERRATNAAKKSAVRTVAKKVEVKAAQDGVISKNAAARKKSKLAKKVNKVQ